MDAGNPNPLYGEEMINNYRNNVDPELYPNVNWLDAVSKDMASNTRGDLTITGGSDILRYALVASYYGERGIFVRDESKDWDSSTRLNKYNIRSNVDINVTKTTVVGISIGGYLQEQNGMLSVDRMSGIMHLRRLHSSIRSNIQRDVMYVSGNELIRGQRQHSMAIRQLPAPKLNHCSRLNKI